MENLYVQWYEYMQLFTRASIMTVLLSIFAIVLSLLRRNHLLEKMLIYGIIILSFISLYITYDTKKRVNEIEKELVQKYGACETYRILAKYYGEEYNWLYNKAYRYCELNE